MKNKKTRLQLISDLLRSNVIGNQEDLQTLLKAKHSEVTQATLSRDLKQLKVVKTPLPNGAYKYVLPVQSKAVVEEKAIVFSANGGVLNVEFSGNLAVVKTKMGFASAVAWDIDSAAKREILGTIAGDDTLLLIPRNGVTHSDILEIINQIFGHKQ